MTKESKDINARDNEIAKLRGICCEYSKSKNIYELIILCEFMNEIDINHKYFKIDFPMEYKKYFRKLNNEEIICKVIKKLNIAGNTYYKNDKSIILYKILGELYQELDNLVANNKMGYILSIMSMIEYNRYIATVIVAWARGKRDIQSTDNTANVLVQILNSKEHNDRAQANSFLDRYFATDKNSLEIIFNRIFNLTTSDDNNKIKQIDNHNIHSIKIDELIEISRAIVTVYSMINEFVKGIYINCDLIINDDNYIEVPFPRKEETIRHFNHIENKNSSMHSQKTIDKFNSVFEDIIGVNIKELFSIHESTAKLNKLMLDQFIIGDFDFWSSIISEESNVDINKVKKLIIFMTFKYCDDYLSSKTVFLTKITRKSIFKIDDILVSPLGLFRTSLINIYHDLLYKNVDKEIIGDFNMEKISSLWGRLDEEFEEFIFNELKTKIPKAIVKKNIQQKDIKYDDEKVELPGEIDVIVLYNKNIFVIECKNIGLRTVFDRINSTRIDFESLKKKKSFQNKLLKKIDILSEYNNKLILANYLGDKENKYNNRPIGIIVTSDYYEIDNSKRDLFSVVVWTELVEKIIKYESN